MTALYWCLAGLLVLTAVAAPVACSWYLERLSKRLHRERLLRLFDGRGAQ